MKLTVLESQPDFPQEDISDQTAAMLELLLSNREVLEASHLTAEQISYLYQFGHHTLVAAAIDNLNSSQQDAFSHGFTTYESISGLVNPAPAEQPSLVVATLQVTSSQRAIQNRFTDTIIDATDRFRMRLPRSTQVIGETATRFYGEAYVPYAVGGAAIAHDLEMNTRAA